MLLKPITPLPIRAYNFLHDRTGVQKPLSFDYLLQKSRKKTGLSDFGNDFNAEALQLLLESINGEAKLHAFGRLMISEKLMGQLENRLWATHWFKKYPEILDQEILPIVLVTGLQRTGTTKMQRLLSELPNARALLSWQALYPAPLGDLNEEKRRIAKTRRSERAVKFISPIFQSIHPIHSEQPEEDVLLLDVHFMSTTSEAILEVPSYAKWLAGQDQIEVYNYEKKLLQLLQWQKGGNFWVLKSPHHLEYLNEFTAVFPNSKIVWMHRSPVDLVPSFLSMLFYSRAMFTREVDMDAIKFHWLNKLKVMVDKGLSYNKLNYDRIIDIHFQEFIENESVVVKRIASEASNFIGSVSDKSTSIGTRYKSRHRYNLADWNLNETDLNTYFIDYLQHIIKLSKNQDER